MKIIKMSKFALLLLCLSVCKILLSFILSFAFHQSQYLRVPEVSAMVKSRKLVIFFAFNFILMAILFKYAKPSKEDFDLISLLAPTASQHEGEKAKCEDFEDKNKDFVLRLEIVELNELKRMEEDKNDGASEVDSDDFHGYDGYDEDNDDDNDGSVDDSYSEDEKYDDLNNRIEEFIAKNNRKWEEEQLNDKFVSK